MVYLKIAIVLLVFAWVKEIKVKIVKGNGNFLIAGIFPMENYEKKINYQSGIMMSEAMKYAVAEFNKNFTEITGYKLKVADTDHSTDVLNDIATIFFQRIPFIIGPYSSQQSYLSSILTRTFQIPTISYAATYTEFSKADPKQTYMLRTIPSDLFRIEAAIDFIKALNWKYVDIVSSYDYDGERDARLFALELSTIDVSVSNHIILPDSEKVTDYRNAINALANNVTLDAVVMFTTKADSIKFLQAWQKKKLKEHFYLMCMYGCSNYLEVVEGIGNISSGMLSMDIYSPEIKGFKEYFMNLKPTVQSSHHFFKFWENVFNCSIINGSCTGYEQLSEGHGYYPLTPVHTVINAVSVIGEALTTLITIICDSESKILRGADSCIVDKSMSSVFSGHVFQILRKNHTFIEDKGTLKQSSQLLPEEDYIVRYDVHSYISKNGYYQNVPIATWTFDRKGNNSKGNLTMFHDWYVKEQKEEKEIENKYITLNDNPVAVMIVILGLIGICLTAGVVVFFVKYDRSHIIRGSGRALSYMILCGVLLLFLCPFFFLGRPSILMCILRSSLPGIASLSCYAPLLLKINQICCNFCKENKSDSPVSSISLLMVSIGIVVVQILLIASRFVLEVPNAEITESKNEDYFTMHCRGDSSSILFLLSVALSVIFMISCTLLAFKTRHDQKNYKEVKYIAITMYTSCGVWLVFLLSYYMVPKSDFMREYFLCGFVIVIGHITLFGLFGYKIRLLLRNENLESSNVLMSQPTETNKLNETAA